MSEVRMTDEFYRMVERMKAEVAAQPEYVRRQLTAAQGGPPQ